MKVCIHKLTPFFVLLSACGAPLKEDRNNGNQATTSTTQSRAASADFHAIWGGWTPEVKVADPVGNNLEGAGPDSARNVGIGQNYNLAIPSPFMGSTDFKYEIVLFTGSELITNPNCPSVQNADLSGDIRACLSFKQPTAGPTPILVIFSGPFGTKRKVINFEVRMKPAPVLALKSQKGIVSTEHLSVDPEHRMPAVNTAGEFRIKAVYDGQEILNPSVTPAAEITRDGEDYVIQTETPGKYVFSASWKNQYGPNTNLQKTVVLNAERRYQAGEPGGHGISSNGGSIQCSNTGAKAYSVKVKTDEQVGSNEYTLDVAVGASDVSSPKIYKRGDQHVFKYLFFTLDIQGDAQPPTCRIKFQNASTDL